MINSYDKDHDINASYFYEVLSTSKTLETDFDDEKTSNQGEEKRQKREAHEILT